MNVLAALLPSAAMLVVIVVLAVTVYRATDGAGRRRDDRD